MGMVMRNHELVESGAYTYGVIPKVVALRGLAAYRDSDVSASISIDALELSKDLDPSVNLSGEPVMDKLVSSLPVLSLISGPNPPVRFMPVISNVGAVQKLSVVGTGSNGGSVDRWSKGAIPALKSLLGEEVECTSNSALSFASYLAAKKQFKRDELYQSNWYREYASDNSFILQ
ncbi:hypothetical protein AYI68_g6579 [Smittium mucronatum]|uniref:Uncharacterized protein n=1 Tax=Smittium mucronatum TaxID=133383 RepID=A0A1R0GR43_9FUNG|nr:hypothetical protein AYI68_g6579 [Smittium mucronatum]